MSFMGTQNRGQTVVKQVDIDDGPIQSSSDRQNDLFEEIKQIESSGNNEFEEENIEQNEVPSEPIHVDTEDTNLSQNNAKTDFENGNSEHIEISEAVKPTSTPVDIEEPEQDMTPVEPEQDTSPVEPEQDTTPIEPEAEFKEDENTNDEPAQSDNIENIEISEDVGDIEEEITDETDVKEEPVSDPITSPMSEEALEIVNTIVNAIELNVIEILNEKYCSISESSSEEGSNEAVEEMKISVTPAQNVATIPSPKKRNYIRSPKEETNPSKLVSTFQKDDDDRVRTLRIDILHQSESLSSKLAKRRRQKGVVKHGKRVSLYEPTGDAMSQSFFVGGIEDTFATDNMFNNDHLHSFNVGQEEEEGQDFKEIFKVLDELEDDTQAFMSPSVLESNNKSDEDQTETQPSPTKQAENDAKMAEFEKKKKEAIADVKSTYDDEIKKLKKQGKNPMIKNMIKNVKKERDEAVERVKSKFDSELKNIMT